MNYILIAIFIFIVIQYYQKKIENFSFSTPSYNISLDFLRSSFNPYFFDIPAYKLGQDSDPNNLPIKIDGNIYRNSDLNEYNDISNRIIKNKQVVPMCNDCMNTRVKNPDISPSSTCGTCVFSK